MENQTKSFGELAKAVTTEATSQGPSTRASTFSEAERKRAFLETFRRWSILFKRKDGANIESEKWLIAEYYDSLKHLSPEGLARLTTILKEECIFFPSIKECLDRTKPQDPFDYSSNCLRGDQYFLPRETRLALAKTRAAIGYQA